MNSVLRIVAQRLGLGLITLLVVSVIIFSAVELLPGDFAQERLGQAATPEAVAAIRKQLGLDQPPVTRYFQWLGGALQGDFGVSFGNNRPVAGQLVLRFPTRCFWRRWPPPLPCLSR